MPQRKQAHAPDTAPMRVCRWPHVTLSATARVSEGVPVMNCLSCISSFMAASVTAMRRMKSPACGLLLLRGQGAANPPALIGIHNVSDAFLRSASTGMLLPIRVTKAVVEIQFLTRSDVAQGDE